ncbi:MAG: S66 peptidase family protein [Alphaproteobacteria bacterium]
MNHRRAKPIAPPLLKPGDTIGVMAPSSYVEKEDIEKSKAALEARGYKVFIHPQTYEREHQSAGTALQKTLALQGLWQRPDINAIWAARGGNRALWTLDTINFKKMKAAPKILIGYSDITTLLNGVYAHTGITTFHGPVFKDLHKHKELEHALDVLSGKITTWDFKQAEIIKDGTAEGPLVGGNLSLFQYLPQTLPGKFWKGSILFLEDCSEEWSRIDRMLLHLKRLGVFREIAGLIFGEFTDMKDSSRPYGFTLQDIVKEHTEGLDIPVLINAPFGHGANFLTLPVGATAILDAYNKTLIVKNQAPKV